jgi:septal ring factor EnvC (AmiA/AmiB activator)
MSAHLRQLAADTDRAIESTEQQIKNAGEQLDRLKAQLVDQKEAKKSLDDQVSKLAPASKPKAPTPPSAGG